MCTPKARLLCVVRKLSDHTIVANAKISKVCPFSKIFIRRLYRLKNSKFYCHENYPLYGKYLKLVSHLLETVTLLHHVMTPL